MNRAKKPLLFKLFGKSAKKVLSSLKRALKTTTTARKRR